MRILFFGTSIFALPVLQALHDNVSEEIVAVVTQPDRPSGRGGKLMPTPVKERAVALGLPVLQPESCRAPEFLEQARALDPALIVVVAYGQFLPDSLLSLAPCGAVNLHGSLLPRFRGAAPIQRTLMASDDRAGVCLMWMVRAMDAGDVIACADTPITSEDTGGTLTERLSRLAADLLLAWLPALAAGTAPRHPQDPDAVTFAPPIGKDERTIDWRQPAAVIERHVRALAPAPSAVTTFRGEPIKILFARTIQGEGGEPGAVVEMFLLQGPVLATGDGRLVLTILQPAGKRPMTGAEFLRGQRLVIGERFGDSATAG